ncbi:MAG: tetratricopeptide repeat protein, partial [bacterium]
AIELFGESAAGGNPEARSKLASIILSGKVAKEQFPKTLEWLHDSAQAGNPSAMFVLGRAFDEQTVWEENLKSAQMWYTTAAEAYKRTAAKTKNSAQRNKYEFAQEKATEAASRVKELIEVQNITQK